MEVALAKERESLAEARAMISAHKVTLDERVKATEEACKRQALDDFMHDIRVEERSYARESKTASSSKKTVVMQERLYFRNIPLSNWIETEMLVESSGDDLPKLPSSFATSRNIGPSSSDGQSSMSRLLEQMGTGQEAFSPAGD